MPGSYIPHGFLLVPVPGKPPVYEVRHACLGSNGWKRRHDCNKLVAAVHQEDGGQSGG